MPLQTPDVAKIGGFKSLVLTPVEELPKRLAKKQMELWEFVEGRSQHSFLDRFKPPTPRGGARVKGQRNGILPGEPGNELPGSNAAGDGEAGGIPPGQPGVIPASEARPDNWWYAKYRDERTLLACDRFHDHILFLEALPQKGEWLDLPPEFMERLKAALAEALRLVRQTKI